MQGHYSTAARESPHIDAERGLELAQGALGPTTLSLLGQTLTSFSEQKSGGLNQAPFSMTSQGLQGLGVSVDGNRQLNPSMQEQVNTMQPSYQSGQSTTLSNLLECNSGSQQGGSSTQALMNSLNLLQQNIGALQALVPLISHSSQQAANGMQSHQLQQQQAAASAGVAAVISQLAVAAAGILPQVGGHQGLQSFQQQNNMLQQHQSQPVHGLLSTLGNSTPCQYVEGNNASQGVTLFSLGGQDIVHQNNGNMLASEAEKNEDADGYVETLPEGSYDVVEMDPVEILAEHTHFCEICGKGFKRDANLRMHMRGHGDEYKTPAALSRPDRDVQDLASSRPKRYSCPYVGCKRNRKHKKFQPLKTMLCVKNHYRRSHCPKLLTCSKCNAKRFSVVADLKTHEKHCGRDKWMCSCRTTFSRKDKLLGHLSLFAGHTPAMPLHIMEEGINNSGNNISNSNISINNASASSQIDMNANHQQLLPQLASATRQMSFPEQSSGSNIGGFSQSLAGNNFYNSSLLQGLFTSNLLDNNVGGLR